VQLPTRITPELCEILERHDIQMLNIHINHPKEITPLLKERIKLLRKAGVMVGNQAVMLKGINDSVEVLRDLCMECVSMGVRPYYVYSCDASAGNDQYVVGLERMLELYHGLRGWVSGPAIPTFIVDGIAGLGKMPVTPKYYELNEEGELIFTNYEGKSVNMRHLNRHED
jgi:lysine 2,3-aminomutase